MSNLKYPNAGSPWTELEALNLAEAFLSGADLESLIEAHGRTPSSIVSALTNKGLLIPRGKAYYKVDPIPFVTFKAINELKDN